ncbi:MAG TPA: helix-turn-helix transcriptional regulator, partial [Pilimelia sp.]|nr:helix-turn-helix transcriptional regulator [Pilimelia sp.]
RSAALTRDPQRRAGRLVASARDAWLGGEPDQAYASLGEADRHAVDPANRAAVAHLRAQFELRRGIAPDAYRMLLDGAVAAAHRAPGTALRMFAEASEAASYVGDVAGMVAAGRAAEDVPPVGAGEEFWRDQVVGVADLLEGRAAEGERRLRRLIERGPTLTEPQQLVLAGTASVYLGEIHVAFGFLERAAVAARVADMTGNLPYVLEFLAATEESRGRLAASQALSEEGLRLAEETGQDTSRCQHLANLAILAAWRGDAEECHRLAAATSELALARRLGFPAARAAWALAILDLGAGRYPAALARLQQLTQAGPGTGHPVVVFASTLDRVEAAVRAGEPAHARAALADVAAYTVTAGPWPRAVVACCRALLADDDAAGDAFEEALALHKEGRTPPPHRARTHLLYGEWLRRARRRVEAREHLRVAVEMFEQVGAPPWADRARVELRAAGAATGRRDVDTLTRLTPQELRIAQLAGDGQSTRDIAAQLFLSPRTVEYHLYKMFPKLGITSRTELVRLLAGASTADGTA